MTVNSSNSSNNSSNNNHGLERTGIELMAKGFASTTDMAEKKITFSEIGTDLYAFTAEGDPNSAIIVGDDGCLVFDAQSTPAMANKVIERVRAVTDKPIKYVVLSHYHAVRVLGASAYKAQAVIASQETYRLVEERGQQDWDSEYGRFPRLFRPDLADAHLRRRDVALSRQTRSAADAARRRSHLRRYRRLGAGCRGDVLRRPHRISFGLLLRRRAFARMAGDAERNSRL
jgi:glyoxylase-like metal-dependent hydrolase (beta-lactamase superfamily II)